MQSNPASTLLGIPNTREVVIQRRAKPGLRRLARRTGCVPDGDICTISVGFTGDASLVLGWTGGVMGAWSLRNNPKPPKEAQIYSNAAYTMGISAGGDIAPEIGFWTAYNDNLQGEAHGFVFGVSYYGGMAMSFWFDYKGGFIGFTLIPQIGASAELEYMRGVTCGGTRKTKSKSTWCSK